MFYKYIFTERFEEIAPCISKNLRLEYDHMEGFKVPYLGPLFQLHLLQTHTPPYRAYDEDYYENEYNRFYIKKIIKLYKEIKLKKWCASGLNQ